MRVPAIFLFVLSIHAVLPGCATTATAKDQVLSDEVLSDTDLTFTEMANEENRLREELFTKGWSRAQ